MGSNKVGKLFSPMTYKTVSECLGNLSNFRQYAKVPNKDEAVVVTDDGRTIVCWHPEPVVPYELTKPLPEKIQSDTIMNTENSDAMKKMFRRQHPFFVRRELQQLTFTTK